VKVWGAYCTSVRIVFEILRYLNFLQLAFIPDKTATFKFYFILFFFTLLERVFGRAGIDVYCCISVVGNVRY